MKPNRGGSRPSTQTGSRSGMEEVLEEGFVSPWPARLLASLHRPYDPSWITISPTNVWPCKSHSGGPQFVWGKGGGRKIPTQTGPAHSPVRTNKKDLGIFSGVSRGVASGQPVETLRVFQRPRKLPPARGCVIAPRGCQSTGSSEGVAGWVAGWVREGSAAASRVGRRKRSGTSMGRRRDGEATERGR